MDPSSGKSRDQSRVPSMAWTSLPTATTSSAAVTTNWSRYLSLLNHKEYLGAFCDSFLRFLRLLPSSVRILGRVLYPTPQPM